MNFSWVQNKKSDLLRPSPFSSAFLPKRTQGLLKKVYKSYIQLEQHGAKQGKFLARYFSSDSVFAFVKCLQNWRFFQFLERSFTGLVCAFAFISVLLCFAPILCHILLWSTGLHKAFFSHRAALGSCCRCGIWHSHLSSSQSPHHLSCSLLLLSVLPYLVLFV